MEHPQLYVSYASFHLGSTRASWRGRDWASFLGFPTCFLCVEVYEPPRNKKCANKIPRQQLLGCLASSTFDGRWHIGPHLPRKYWNCFCGTKDHTSRVRCNHRWPQWAGLGQHSRTVFGLYSYMFCWLGKGIMTPLSGKRGTHHHCVRYPCHLTLPGTIMPPL